MISSVGGTVVTGPVASGLTHEPILTVRDLRTGFRTPRGIAQALDGVSLAVDRGRVLGVVGESGSGKTALVRSIMRLLPHGPTITSGSVRLKGTELTTLDRRALSDWWGKEVAMVFQDPMSSLNPVLRIGDQIAETVRRHLAVSRPAARERAVELLASVGIPDPRRRVRDYPHQLSGGMRQRVMVAIALSCGPSLLLADEPTTALDVTVQAQILDLLGAAQRAREMAAILVTHDLGVVAGRTDEIIVLYAGQVVEQAPTPTLFARPMAPYTEALLRSMPRIDRRRAGPLPAIPGRPPDLVDIRAGCRFAPRCPYAQDRCRAETPPLVEASPGHAYRCFFPRASGVA